MSPATKMNLFLDNSILNNSQERSTNAEIDRCGLLEGECCVVNSLLSLDEFLLMPSLSQLK